MGKKLICGYCDHFFDAADKRGHVMSGDADPRYPPRCPACTIQTLGGREIWGVWNDCQGIWTDGLGGTKADAIAHLNSGRYDGCECRVVPLRVYPEQDDRIHMREWLEAERVNR